MEGTKEADLITAVLMYAMRCLAEGDQAALRHMNFGIKEIEALREMRVADLYRIESLRAHCLEIALNRQVYWPMIEHLSEQRAIEDTIQALIAADAPQEMMQVLFGLNPRDYTRLRRTLLVDPSIGRPPELDEASSHRLWEAWSGRVNGEASGLLTPAQYLVIQGDTGLSMRAIWNLTQRWAEYGHLNGPIDADAVQTSTHE
jgi:hypothetical protein